MVPTSRHTMWMERSGDLGGISLPSQERSASPHSTGGAEGNAIGGRMRSLTYAPRLAMIRMSVVKRNTQKRYTSRRPRFDATAVDDVHPLRGLHHPSRRRGLGGYAHPDHGAVWPQRAGRALGAVADGTGWLAARAPSRQP